MSSPPTRFSPAPAHRRDSCEAPILLVESSAELGGELVEQLRADRLRTVLAQTAEHARVLARGQMPRAVVLGHVDPPRGALDLLDEIRRGEGERAAPPSWDARLPAIVISLGHSQLELLRAFEAGADDFVSRPVSYLELRARLRALLRRVEGLPCASLVRVGSLEIDCRAHEVRYGPTPVELCRLEYELLVHLARNPTAVCSKQELLGAIWKRHSNAGMRTVDSHASRLRRKLNAAGAAGLIVNVWGVGYRLI